MSVSCMYICQNCNQTRKIIFVSILDSHSAQSAFHQSSLFFLFFFVKAISQHGIARWSARVSVARGDRFIGLSAELSLAIVCACVPGTRRRAASKAQHLNYHQIACDQDNRKLTGCHTHTTEHLF